MFNNSIELITETYTTDDIGQQVSTYSYVEVFAQKKSISMNEFFNAGQQKIKAEKCFVIRSCEYSGETKIRYPVDETDCIYSVYRVYTRADEFTELYCQARCGNG